MYTHDIDYVIRTLGVGATYRGYRYLSYGIELCLTDEEYLLAISKQLYPEIARKYKTTVGSVERDIRTVIRVCWENGYDQLQSYSFRYYYMSVQRTGEFFDILVAYLSRNKPVLQAV
ncbi:MAG: sporulation initiation factor Spo0A C-terminal domain-containing protein [Dorea formicigenerans]